MTAQQLRMAREEFLIYAFLVVIASGALALLVTPSLGDNAIFLAAAVKVAFGAVFFRASRRYGASGWEAAAVTALSVMSLFWIAAVIIVLVRFNQRLAQAETDASVPSQPHRGAASPGAGQPVSAPPSSSRDGAWRLSLDDWTRILTSLGCDAKYGRASWDRLLTNAGKPLADRLMVTSNAIRQLCSDAGWPPGHASAIEGAVREHQASATARAALGRILSFPDFEARLSTIRFSEKQSRKLWELLVRDAGSGPAEELLVTPAALQRACATSWSMARHYERAQTVLQLAAADALPAPELPR
ncbi:MAG: hypothetical protein JWO74_2785 [Solirubrobacterales bacterium]|nr:hypothetical protein [Solirubrobacterales bacterium]